MLSGLQVTNSKAPLGLKALDTGNCDTIRPLLSFKDPYWQWWRKFLEAKEPGSVTPTQLGGTAPTLGPPVNLLGKPASRFVSCEPAFSDQAHSIRHLAQDFICSAFLGGQRETGTE